jgi:hypothetical protein
VAQNVTIQASNNIISSVKNGVIPTITTGPLGALDAIDNATLQKALQNSKDATSERLYVVESRAAASIYNGGSQWSSDRGPIASVKLITTNNLLGGTPLSQRYADSKIPEDGYLALLGYGQNTNNNTNGYDRFILTNCDVSYSEKTQIQTTFGDSEVIYFFGKNPVVINLGGVLVDSLHNNWFGDFINLYQNFLRGTALAQNFEMLELVLPNMKVIGSILTLSHQQQSVTDTTMGFSMQFYAKEITMLPQPVLQSNAVNTGASLTASPIFSSTSSSAANLKNPTLPSGSTQLSAGGFNEPAWIKNLGMGTNTGYLTFKNAIVSPVVSVIATITKFISAISNDVSAIIGAFTNPLNMVLRDITSIANQATAVANLIVSSISNIAGIVTSTEANLKLTLATLKNTAGVISRLPQDISSTFQTSFHTGRMKPTAAILSSGVKNKNNKSAVLSSGTPYTVQSSFVI